MKRAAVKKVDIRKKRFRVARRYMIYVLLFIAVLFALQRFTG